MFSRKCFVLIQGKCLSVMLQYTSWICVCVSSQEAGITGTGLCIGLTSHWPVHQRGASLLNCILCD